MSRECNNDAMDNFQKTFKHLEQIGILNKNDNIDIWTLHRVCTNLIQKVLDAFKEHCNNHPIRTARANSPIKICTVSALRDQLIHSAFSQNTSSILRDWQNVWDESEVNQVVFPSIGEHNLNQNQLSIVDNHMDEDVDSKVKHTNIRMFLRSQFYV